MDPRTTIQLNPIHVSQVTYERLTFACAARGVTKQHFIEECIEIALTYEQAKAEGELTAMLTLSIESVRAQKACAATGAEIVRFPGTAK